mgnify:CR=1 FL=1
MSAKDDLTDIKDVEAAYQKLQDELKQLEKKAQAQPLKEMEAKMTIPPSQSYIESEEQYIHEVSLSKRELSQEITSQKISLFMIVLSLLMIAGVAWWLYQLLIK